MLSEDSEHKEAVSCLAVSTSDRLLASGSRDKSLRVAALVPQVSTLCVRHSAHDGPVRCIAFSRSAQVLASGARTTCERRSTRRD